MTKIISIIVSILMLVMTSIFPGFVWPGTETVETGAASNWGISSGNVV
jgi:hypothetical protein